MTDLVIYKFPLVRDPFRYHAPSVTVPWFPSISRVVHLAAQNINDPLPTLWVEQVAGQLDMAPCKELFFVRATGEPYTNDADNYVGSSVCAGGQFVWHVFSRSI